MPSSQPIDKGYSSLERVPEHIGIIMDGNGRWAQDRGLPRLAGHRAGVENLRTLIRAAVEFGVAVLTIYAFSTENWGRPGEEVRGLLRVFERVIDRELPKLHEEGVCLRHVGTLGHVHKRLQDKVLHAVELTKHNERLVLNVAFDYGSRAELVNAIRRIISDGVPAEAVDVELVNRYLYTAGLPDPDLIIRTGGEMRLSNFLLWQGWYAEYYATPVYWPDFGKAELYEALQEYCRRERRLGLVPS